MARGKHLAKRKSESYKPVKVKRFSDIDPETRFNTAEYYEARNRVDDTILEATNDSYFRKQKQNRGKKPITNKTKKTTIKRKVKK